MNFPARTGFGVVSEDPEDDERDISEGEVVRDVLLGEPANVDKLDLTDMPSAKVEMRDARGQRLS